MTGIITTQGYRAIQVNGRQVLEHRHVWEQSNGPISKGMHIYHKNGDKLDNRIENLDLRGAGDPRGGWIEDNGRGYRRLRVGARQTRYEHQLVWEQHNGPIPEGMHVHHRNEDTLDNRIENLELVNPLTHRRIHSSLFVKDGLEHKTCTKCGEDKLLDQYYKTITGGTQSNCKSCANARSVEYNRRKRLRASKESQDRSKVVL